MSAGRPLPPPLLDTLASSETDEAADDEEEESGRVTSSMVKTLWLRLESMLSRVAAF